MKNLKTNLTAAIAALTLLISGAAFAEHEKDCIMMKDGKVMVMKDGKSMMMEKEMMLTNGAKVMADGTVMMKDGTKMMMKNGDMINMDGTMKKGDKKPDKKGDK